MENQSFNELAEHLMLTIGHRCLFLIGASLHLLRRLIRALARVEREINQ